MKSVSGSKARKRPKERAARANRAQIAATLSAIEQIQPPTAKAAEAISMLKDWLKDDSGYDEQAWPELKKSLNRERRRVGGRRLFRD